MNFRSALSYSAVESIGSRVFDFLTLWVVLNTLDTSDLAKFGLATSAIFVFNFFLVAPETALLKYQKIWQETSSLSDYVTAFVSFSISKILIHYVAAVAIYFYQGDFNWVFYAVIFSAITQQIQAAEIARIYKRMDLRQKQVACFEVFSKAILAGLCLMLFLEGSIELYFAIYLGWSFVVGTLWLAVLRKDIPYRLLFNRRSFNLVIGAMMGYSFWAHVSGALTMYLYNGSLLFLGWMSGSEDQVALYTVVNKIANLFFVIPMFFQSFVPIVLANASIRAQEKFNKMLIASGAVSCGQFFVFVLFGKVIGRMFGLEDERDVLMFYQLGLVASFGIMLFNLSRPLGTYILIRGSPKMAMISIFIPSGILASLVYPIGVRFFGVKGAAYGSAIVYLAMGVLLVRSYLSIRRAESEAYVS